MGEHIEQNLGQEEFKEDNNEEISREKFLVAIKRLKYGKVPACDKIMAEMI